MLKYTYKTSVAALMLSVWIAAQASANENTGRAKIDFRGGSSLVFSLPLKGIEEKTFGPGWKMAVLENASGRKISLFSMEFFTSMGGVIFSRDYPPRVSPSGKYAVLDVLRAGVVDPGSSGRAENSSRQYCPVVDTASGCIVSMQTGELCGGDWSEKADEWVVTGYEYDATTTMVRYEFSGANDLWDQFQKSVKLSGAVGIKQYLVDNGGLINVMTCEPPSKGNRTSYSLIARQLIKEGDRTDAAYIEKELAVVAIDSTQAKNATIKISRAYLYDRPDSKAQAKMYLVKGDVVRRLDESGRDWVKIEYVKKNGTAIEKWIQAASIK